MITWLLGLKKRPRRRSQDELRKAIDSGDSSCDWDEATQVIETVLAKVKREQQSAQEKVRLAAKTIHNDIGESIDSVRPPAASK
jgi:hypothetical protein